MKAYESLGAWFEILNDDCGYAAWEEYLKNLLAPYSFCEGIDVGCGNGYFTRAFEQSGYRMTGYDISLPMLNRAKELSAKHRLKSEYILGDILTLKVKSRVDFALAINDCLNYIPPQKLTIAMKRVCSCLKKGGVFLFDISSQYKLTEKVPGVSVDDRENVTYLSFNRLEGDHVNMEVTLFVKEKDGSYSRQDESQVQYIHREQDVVKALEEAGFSLVSVTGHLGESKICSDRLVFVARRS
ncbi:MAG: class I SAM-dependent methyltransferase [Clostridia bacterium]|nr:class I SAM-dependent methyltransferase [Clostridia bacterium]